MAARAKTGPEVITLFSMLNSAEHIILNTRKYNKRAVVDLWNHYTYIVILKIEVRLSW